MPTSHPTRPIRLLLATVGLAICMAIASSGIAAAAVGAARRRAASA